MSNYFDELVKKAGNEFASKVADGLESDTASYLDTGSYALNALLSGSIYGGIPSNKVMALAGVESTGKTYYLLSIIKNFLDSNPDGAAILFESEGALTTQQLTQRGMDISRIYIIPVITIQEFRTQCVKILDEYLATEESKRKPMLMALDSMGNLSTSKEVGDIAEGKDTRDMTRAPLIRGAFRVITLKLNRAKIPMIVTNHTYQVIGCGTKDMMVRTGDGIISVKDIKAGNTIKRGQWIQSSTGPSMVPTPNPYVVAVDDEVEQVHGPYGVSKSYRLTLEDGSQVQVTGEHKFMRPNGEWARVVDLHEEDALVCVSDEDGA